MSTSMNTGSKLDTRKRGFPHYDNITVTVHERSQCQGDLARSVCPIRRDIDVAWLNVMEF